jgi:hypothetical protein
MLFMTIVTYEPGKRDEVIKRRLEKGAIAPKGMKIKGEWSAIGGGRVFRLVDLEDPKVGFEAAFAWSDLGKIEIIPVLETEGALKSIKSK